MKKILIYTKNLVLFLLTFYVGSFCFADNKYQLLEKKFPKANLKISMVISCIEGSVKILPVEKEFKSFFIISKDLNEKCFQEISKIYCDENCNTKNQSVVKVDNHFFIMWYEYTYNIDATIINKNIIHYEMQMDTHRRNFIVNIENSELISFPNGNLEFHKDSIIVKEQKSYFKETGPFWYNSKRDYSGNIIEFLDIKDGTCLSLDNFNDNLRNKLVEKGKKELCVFK